MSAITLLSLLYNFIIIDRTCKILATGLSYHLVLDKKCIYYISTFLRFSTIFKSSSLICIFGSDSLNKNILITYVYLINSNFKLILSSVSEKGLCAYSIDDLYINSSWYEREVSEFFGIKFLGSADTRTLLLPYNNTTNPLIKSMPSNTTGFLGMSRMTESLRWYSI